LVRRLSTPNIGIVDVLDQRDRPPLTSVGKSRLVAQMESTSTVTTTQVFEYACEVTTLRSDLNQGPTGKPGGTQ
jgi:hypothetical protein